MHKRIFYNYRLYRPTNTSVILKFKCFIITRDEQL